MAHPSVILRQLYEKSQLPSSNEYQFWSVDMARTGRFATKYRYFCIGQQKIGKFH